MIKIKRATEENEYGTATYNGGSDIFDTKHTGVPYYDDLIRNPKYFRLNKGVEGKIEYMTPMEYFEACADGFNKRGAATWVNEEIRQVSSDRIFNKLKNVLENDKVKLTLPYLNYSDNGFEQEGRHRMYLAMQLFGEDEKFPVLVVKDAENLNEIEPYLVNDGNLYAVKDARMGDIVFGPSDADTLKFQILSSLDDYPVQIRGKLATIAWDAYYMEHPDDDEAPAEEAVAYENKFTDALKKAGSAIKDGAKNLGQATKNVYNQMKYGTMDEDEIRDMGGGEAETNLAKALQSAGWVRDQNKKNIYKRNDRSKDLIALTNDGGHHESFELAKGLNQIDTKSTKIKDLLKKAGASDKDKFVRFADPENSEQEISVWKRETGKAGQSQESAENLNKQFKIASPGKKRELLEDNLPKTIKAGKKTIINALMEELEPFTSDLYKIVNYLGSQGQDVSADAATELSENGDFYLTVFSSDGRNVTPNYLKGLDLSKSGFQLKAIKKVADLGLSLDLHSKDGSWLSTDEMKKAITEHKYSDEDVARFKASKKPVQSKKAKAYIDYLQDGENTLSGKPLTLEIVKEKLNEGRDYPIEDWSDLTDDEVALLVDLFGKRR